MKKIFIITIILLVATMQLAVAESDCPDSDAIQKKIECPEFDFGDTFVGDNITVDVMDDQSVVGHVTIEITAVKIDGSVYEALAFDWTSDIPVCFMNVKSGAGDNEYNVGGQYSGSGSVLGYGEINEPNAISHITFCFCEPENKIPEFPTLALPIAAIIGLAFIMQRRKE
ncbi:MAG: hypothetical protein PWQ75_1902 [Methanolobus sp.]|jgi:hypothetical protein|uniref:PEF-CTERM sorting domain-containing protein n=1 Tax=Methanolobus TaxID=2220 RepID=UPI00064F9E4C|nr:MULTISPECIES: PEF-CTERM sorting domain-containing protein [Methanolobus]MDI3486627.1 hypothetical protein [Methanolobus sp.]MDK2832150.1 hypothetical protein [Methanolobus sp.]